MAVFEGLYLSTGDHLSIPFEWTPLGRHHFLYAGGNKVIHYLQQGVIEEDIWTFFRRRPEVRCEAGTCIVR